jgi:hypothetical protein
MPFKPNYRQQRNERTRIKNERKQEKLQRRQEAVTKRKTEGDVLPVDGESKEER